MSRTVPSMIRFETAADVLATFPKLAPFLPCAPQGESPLEFLHLLAQNENPYGAPAFAAHILPRRQCIDFLCAAFRVCKPAPVAPGDPDMRLVEAWAQNPDENLRRTALARVDQLDQSEPVTWALRAVSWSGGNIMSDPKLPPLPAPVELTPQAVAAALSLALARVPQDKVRDTIAAWVEACICIADEGQA